MLAKCIALMLLASCVHADVDIVVRQQGPDVEWVLSGSVNLDGLGLIVENLCAFDQSMSVFADSENDSVALNGSSEDICTDFYQLAGPQILAEGTLLGCTTTTPPRASTADGFFNMNYRRRERSPILCRGRIRVGQSTHSGRRSHARNNY